MAARRQIAEQSYSRSRYGQAYAYGNVVRQPKQTPMREERLTEPPRRVSRRVYKNRKKALSLSTSYVVFLSVAALCAVLVCVLYLQLQTNMVSRSENITALQKELSNLTEANDTAYNAAIDTVNLEAVRNKAINEMGMVYASQGQVIEYESPTSDYVKQYSSIPESGILEKSQSVTE